MAFRAVTMILAGLCAMTAPHLLPAADPPAARPGPPPPPLLPPPGGPTVAAAVSADGRWVLTGDYAGGVRLWSTARAEPVWTTYPVDEPLDPGKLHTLAVGFAADGKRALWAWGGGVAEIDRDKGKVLRVTKFPKGLGLGWRARGGLLFLPGSDECVYHDPDERLVRFDFATGKRHPKFDLRLAGVGTLFVELSPDGKRVLAHNGRYVSEWDLETGELCRLFGSLPVETIAATYYPNGDRVCVRGSTLRALDRKTGEKTEVPEALAKYSGRLWFSPDGGYAVGLRGDSKEDRVEVIRVEGGKVARSFSSEGVWYRQRNLWRDPKDTTWSPEPGQLAFTADGKSVLLTGGEAKTAMGIWDLATGKRTHTFREE